METFKLSKQRKHMSNGNESINFVDAVIMNSSAKFQLHPPNVFGGDDCFIFFRELRISVAMATNHIQRFGQNSYVW